MRTNKSIWCESQDLLWCYLVSAHLHRDNVFSWGADIYFFKANLSGLCLMFSSELWFITEKLSCGNFLKEKLPQFFYCLRRKTGGEKHSRQFTNASKTRGWICKNTQKRYRRWTYRISREMFKRAWQMSEERGYYRAHILEAKAWSMASHFRTGRT